jgi:UDP-2,3-diacylglucosamine pyrophosphatase LpxH
MVMRKTVLRFRTIVLSDVHLGIPECRVDEVNHFLKHTESDKLILNGDIIDSWSLLRKGGWTKRHTRFVRLVLKKLEKKGTEVVYLRGNHDDVLGKFLPLQLHRLRIVESHVHRGLRGSYLVIHGDVFDVVTRQHRYLAILGHVGYQGLMKLNRVYNRFRRWRGREYFSLSKAIKAKVKGAVSYMSNFEQSLENLTRSRDCDGVICGHIHTPADKQIGSIHYLNSGDWVESLTALVEHHDGRFEVLSYDEFRRRLRKAAAVETRRRAARRRPRLPVPA